MIASHLKSATLSLADLRIRYWNSNFEHDQKDSQSWFFSSNLKTKVVCSVWPQNCRMAAWLVTSQSAPKDGVLLCEVSHHRPSNKLTSPNQPSLNFNEKTTAKNLIKRTSLMKPCKTIRSESWGVSRGTSELQRWQHGTSQSAPKDGVFWLHFSSESTQLKLRVDQSRQTEKKKFSTEGGQQK